MEIETNPNDSCYWEKMDLEIKEIAIHDNGEGKKSISHPSLTKRIPLPIQEIKDNIPPDIKGIKY